MSTFARNFITTFPYVVLLLVTTIPIFGFLAWYVIRKKFYSGGTESYTLPESAYVISLGLPLLWLMAPLMSIGPEDARHAAYAQARSLTVAAKSLGTQSSIISNSGENLDLADPAIAEKASKALNEMRNLIPKIEDTRSRLSRELNEPTIQQTLTLREAKQQIATLSIVDASEKAALANGVLEGEGFSAESSQEILADAKVKSESAASASDALANSAIAISEKVIQSIIPLQMTESIMLVILSSMQPNPNIHYVQHYWKAQEVKLKDQDKKLVQPE